jgi:hypothetical protein
MEPHEPGAYDLHQHVYAIQYVHDLNGRRSSLTYPTNLTTGTWVTSYSYQPGTGLLSHVTGPSGAHWSFIYDNAGRDTLRYFPGGQELRGYDADSRLRTRSQTSWVIGSMRSDSYRYDARGRILQASRRAGRDALVLRRRRPRAHRSPRIERHPHR